MNKTDKLKCNELTNRMLDISQELAEVLALQCELMLGLVASHAEATQLILADLKPHGGARQRKPVTRLWDGKTWPSINAAARAEGVSVYNITTMPWQYQVGIVTEDK